MNCELPTGHWTSAAQPRAVSGSPPHREIVVWAMHDHYIWTADNRKPTRIIACVIYG